MESQRVSPFTTEEVKGRLEEELDRNKVKFHNKAAIAKDLGCSPTTIFRWLSGSLPKDPALMFQFCELYGVDMVYWTAGKRSIGTEDLDVESLQEAIRTVEAFTAATGETVTEKQKAKLISLMYTDEVSAASLNKTLDVIG